MQICDPRVDPSLVPEGSKAIVIAEHQTEYQDLPSIRTPDGQIITRWSPTDEERRRLINGEDIFLTILSFGPINPVMMTVGPIDWNTTREVNPCPE